MINKIYGFLKTINKEFSKYFIIGVSAVVLDIASLYVFKEFLYLKPVLAVVLNQLLMINYVFFLNKRWAFKAAGATHKQMVRFYALAGFNYLFSVAWMLVLNEYFLINYLLARLLNIILSVSWNFIIYKYWIFTEKKIEAF